MENYEKKYNEALERARQFSEHPLQEDSANIVEYLFPELKESEDEEIRKALLELVHNTTGDELLGNYKVYKEEAIAWLEKQKEFVSADFDDVWEWADCDELTAPLEKYSKDAIKEMCHAWYDRGIELERKNWFEKQGEKDKPTYNIYSKDVQLTQKEYNKKRVSDEATIKEVEAYKKGLEDAQKIFEKQGEQKPNPYTGTSFEYNGHTFGMCARDNGVEILFDGELKAFLSSEKSFIYPIHPQPSLIPKAAQETTNKTKVEPKFKVGDWIVWYNCIYQVLDNNLTYVVIDTKGLESRYEHSTIDKVARYWTIQDTKDGDVLASDNSIFIFREENIAEKPIAYCGLKATRRGLKNGLFINGGNACWTNEKCNPATKEQRELLFKKMKEAGYEWDEEKKELKIKLKEPDVYEYELERIVDKLNEVIGKLGDIHQVLSKPFQFPYKDYTPPQEPWYKTHGVEKVTPVTCETNNEVKAKDNESK